MGPVNVRIVLPHDLRRMLAMKFNRNGAPRAEAIATRLITLVLGIYTVALFVQTIGVFHIA
jgi:hypothetical protein